MNFLSQSFADGQLIPGEFAFCVPDAAQHVRSGGNLNPHLAWTAPPAATRSLVVTVHDPDVPSRGDDVNQEGREVPAALPRVDFFHWLLVDLPPVAGEIAAGEFSRGVTSRGKPGPAVSLARFAAARQGVNDYTGWFERDAAMRGHYFGYDGPCPPWNDAIVHRYHFTLHALDLARLPVTGRFTGAEVRAAMQGHVLAQAQFTGRYTLNPRL